MTTLKEICARAALVLTDPGHVRWTEPELVFWINDGLRELLTLVPSAYMQHEVVELVPGEVQTLPEDCRNLVELRVMNKPESEPWVCVRKVSRNMLSTVRPGWPTKNAKSEAREYCYEPSDPRRYYVFPPQSDEPCTVELIYHAIPEWLDADATLPVRDDFVMPILNYVLHRAYSKDAEFAGNAQIALTYYQGFKAALSGAGVSV